MIQDVHFEGTEDFEELPLPPKLGAIVWVNYYPDPHATDYMAIPVACVKVYDDGSWDATLEEGEA